MLWSVGPHPLLSGKVKATPMFVQEITPSQVKARQIQLKTCFEVLDCKMFLVSL